MSQSNAGDEPTATGTLSRDLEEKEDASQTAPVQSVRDLKEKHRRGLNRNVYGVRSTVVGHGLPALDPDHEGYRALSSAELCGRSREGILLSGSSGISVSSLLLQRSCLSSTPRIRGGLGRYVSKGAHWNPAAPARRSAHRPSERAETISPSEEQFL